MTFGESIEALKNGERVAREGWNGKGMFLVLVPGSRISANDMRNGTMRAYYRNMGHDYVDIKPHIDMKAADGTMAIGCTASQADMLADDWFIVGGNSNEQK